MAIIKKPGIGLGGRYRSGKQLRQVLGTSVYSWRPIEPSFMVKDTTIKESKSDIICCQICDGLTVDNCVTYVFGGSCSENTGNSTIAAYVDCDYVV